MRTIVVDIDNTLWDLIPVFYKQMKALNPAIPPPEKWRQWGCWMDYANEWKIYDLLRDIHMVQDTFGVYPDAREFLSSLKASGFYIIIASHRTKDTMDATIRWLKKHALPYDEVHLSYDKSILFDKCWAIVDDSPETLDKAVEAKIIGVGLRNPWNEKEKHPLFDNLMEIFQYLQGQCPTRPQ